MKTLLSNLLPYGIIAILIYFIIGMKKELRTSGMNLLALTTDLTTIKGAVNAVQLSSKQVEALLPTVAANIDQMGLKVKNVKVYSETVITKADTFNIHFRDTVIEKPLQFADYKDEWMELQVMCDTTKNCAVYYVRKDSLIMAIHKSPREKWWKLFEKRPIQIKAKMADPNVIISYEKTLMISNKKRVKL